MLGPLLGLLSAASFALNVTVIRRAVLLASASQATIVTVFAGVPIALIMAAATGQLFRISSLSGTSILLLIGGGISQFVIGRYGNYKSIQCLGATASAPLRSLAAVFSVALAIIFLDEKITFLMGVAITLLIISPLFTLQIAGGSRKASIAASDEAAPPSPPSQGSSSGSPAKAHPVFVRKQAEGYLWGLVMGVGYGSTVLFIRAALKDSGMAIAGVLIAYVAGAVVLFIIFAATKQLADAKGVTREAAPWYMLATVSILLAHTFRFIGFSIAPVTLIAPFQEISALFVMFFSYFINRRAEVFGSRVFLAVIVAISGAALLASQA
jgi:drug/metabolite transporter (DMT)-like permease